VIEERVVGNLMHPNPWHRVVGLPALANQPELRRLGADDRMAAHAGLRWRHHRFVRALHLGVAIATIHAELSGV